MRCPKCKATETVETTVKRYPYQESGLENVFLLDWTVYVCTRCDYRMSLVPSLTSVQNYIVRKLVRTHHTLDADSIVFLRKAMGLKVSELADSLEVDRVTVSRWENDHTAIEAHSDFKLRREAVERILPQHERRDMLEEVSSLMHRHYRAGRPASIESIDVPLEIAAAGFARTASVAAPALESAGCL
jgi:transcriptional regulator with XRE-family HTH domain